jgi:hypothetical protein
LDLDFKWLVIKGLVIYLVRLANPVRQNLGYLLLPDKFVTEQDLHIFIIQHQFSDTRIIASSHYLLGSELNKFPVVDVVFLFDLLMVATLHQAVKLSNQHLH